MRHLKEQKQERSVFWYFSYRRVGVQTKGVVANYRGGATKWVGGGASEVLPLQKGGGAGKSFSHAEGGAKSLEVVLTRELEIFSHTDCGHPLEGAREKFYPVLRGGAKSFGPAIFPFCSPPPSCN